MEFHVITLFPELFAAANWPGMVGRALKAGLVKIEAHALREHGLGNYRQVDDTPYGGGSGMVLRPEPMFAAIESALGAHPGLWRVLLTPQGEPLRPSTVRELSAAPAGCCWSRDATKASTSACAAPSTRKSRSATTC